MALIFTNPQSSRHVKAPKKRVSRMLSSSSAMRLRCRTMDTTWPASSMRFMTWAIRSVRPAAFAGAQTGRNLHGGRAYGWGQLQGQSARVGQFVLRLLNLGVCSHVQVEERRLGAGRPGRSETIGGSLEPSRLQQRSSRDRDTDQHGARGPSLIRQVEADEIASLFLDAVADEQSAIDVGRHAPIDAADLGAAKFAEFRWRGFEEA